MPSFSDNFELGYSYRNNLSITVYAERLSKGIGVVPTYIDGMNSLIPYNYINQNKIGAYLNYTYRPISWWNIYFNGNLNFSKNISESVFLNIRDSNGWGSSIRVQNSVYMNQQKTVQLSITYNHYFPSQNGFYKTQSYGNLSARINYTIWKGRINVGLSGNDIFDQQKPIRVLNYVDQVYKSHQMPRVRNISVSLTYNFGNEKVRVSGRNYKIEKNRAL